ncbi:hypothetical protein L3Q82_021098 [Scortum barcoo]|uniref:Uncharacterized protein n=1 Tax=Scortum barcoo TaxID=214431 RepID=A0ACB8X5Q5_9TELE|nr:hypothetical protein L3Q82_021098 [Scortum barcoo]
MGSGAFAKGCLGHGLLSLPGVGLCTGGLSEAVRFRGGKHREQELGSFIGLTVQTFSMCPSWYWSWGLWFAAECEAAGMRISTSKSEARPWFSTGKGWRALSRWVERSCLKWRSSSISRVLFTSEGKMEREIDRRIGAASAVMRSVSTGPSWW